MKLFVFSLFAFIFIQHISQVISSCPPTSGIYLMYRGDCYPNGSFFRDNRFRLYDDYIHCVLPNSTLNGGEWTTPTGGQVNCNSGNIQCIETTSPANISLYQPNNPTEFTSSDDGLYKCCLPTYCSDSSTNIITANLFWYVQIVDFNVELPSDITTFPQQLTLHCITAGSDDYNITFNYSSHQISDVQCPSDANCTRELLHEYNITRDNTITITWDAETISSGSFNQSVPNGDHIYTCNVIIIDGVVIFNVISRISTVTVKVPSFTPSSLTVVNKTTTTITVSWMIPNPTDADGYVVNATSDTAGTVTQQVEGGSQNTTTLRGLTIGTTYNISVRAYQDILGPASSTISEQTFSSVIQSINQTLVSSITELSNTQYHINCLTTDVNATTDVYWLVNGVMKDNSMYTMIDGLIYKNTLLVYPDPLGVSVKVTCISLYGGVNYNQTVILQAPSGPPLNVRGYILNETGIKVNWTILSEANGYVIVLIDSKGSRNVSSTIEIEIVLNNLHTTTYNISVYSYKDVPSISGTQRSLIFDAPSPITSLSVSDVSTSSIRVEWISPSSEKGNYITYHIISYTPSCQELSSLNVTVPVTPYTTRLNYTYSLEELYSGMEYTIRVRGGNVLGESNSMNITYETEPTIPSGSPKSISFDQSSNQIMWEEIDCTKRNGRINEYIVMISNKSITYTMTSRERYMIVNDLVLGGTYNISVAGVNTAGIGPFSDPYGVVVGIVPSSVNTLSSIMGTTWAALSWNEPSFIPFDYPLITYEIGYHIIDNCSSFDNINDIDDQLLHVFNISSSSTNTNVTDLMSGTCYMFGVRGYTVNGHGKWIVIVSRTFLCSYQSEISSTASLSIGLSVVITLIILLSISAAINIPLILYIIKLKRLVSTYSQKESTDDNIVMKPCEPYGVHQYKSHPNDTYEECQPSATETDVYDVI